MQGTLVSIEQLTTPVDQSLRPLGFRLNRKRSWDRVVGEMLQVVHLDRSSYSPRFRLQALFGFRDEFDQRNYRLSMFDVIIRVERILEYKVDFDNALDLEKLSMPAEARKDIIIYALSHSLIPFLEMAVDANGLRQIRAKLPSMNDLFIGVKTNGRLS